MAGGLLAVAAGLLVVCFLPEEAIAQEEAAARAGAASDAAAYSPRRQLKELPCGDGILDYISGSKSHETIIPYDEHCLQKYTDRGHAVALPNTVAVHLTGLPKTGTTWTEVFVGKMLQRVCESGIYPGCKYSPTYRGALATIPSNPRNRRAGKVLRWNVFLKHDPAYDWTCAGFNMTRSSSNTGCHLYKFQDAERNIPDWEQCIFRTPYSGIRKCIPEYMQVPKDLPVMDKIGDDVNKEKKTEVDMTGAVRKYLHVVRDPRDACLSWVHYHGKTGAEDVDEGVHQGCNHYIAWTAYLYHWQMEAFGEIYPSSDLFYRNLMDDTYNEYVRVLAWFGMRASVTTIKKVVEETDMGAMKRMEQNRELPGRNHPGRADAKVRKGGYGNFNDELSAKTIDDCTEAMKVMLPENLLRVFDVLEKGEKWEGPAKVNPLVSQSSKSTAGTR